MKKKPSQKQVIKAVFCPECIWSVGKLLMKDNLTDKQDLKIREHYLQHLETAFKVILV